VSDRETEDRDAVEERPPLGSWVRFYLLEFLNLAILVLLFYLLTKSFA